MQRTVAALALLSCGTVLAACSSNATTGVATDSSQVEATCRSLPNLAHGWTSAQLHEFAEKAANSGNRQIEAVAHEILVSPSSDPFEAGFRLLDIASTCSQLGYREPNALGNGLGLGKTSST